MANEILTSGTTITIDDSGSTPVTIGKVRSMSHSGAAAAIIDTTHLDSTAKEFCVGLQDSGTFALEMDYNYSDLGQLEIYDAENNQSQRTVIITLSNAGTITFEAFVTDTSTEMSGPDDVVRITANFKITGDVTRA